MAGEYASRYKTTRFIGEFTAIVGWVVFALGVIGLFFLAVEKMDYVKAGILTYEQYWLFLALPIAVMVAGLGFVLTGQATRALSDVADNSFKMVIELQKMNEESVAFQRKVDRFKV